MSDFQYPAVSPVESVETLDWMKQQQERPYLDVQQKFNAGVEMIGRSPNLTNYLFDVVDNMMNEGAANTRTLSPEEADDLYPIGKHWDKPVSEYRALKAYDRYNDYTEYSRMLEMSNNSATGSIAEFMGNLVGGFTKDPIMMAGAMVSGGAFGALAKGSAMTGSLYNTYSFLGSNWARAVAARGTVEAIGSLAFDIPSQLITQQLINRSDFSGYEMTGKEVAMNVAMGAAFSGLIGGVQGVAARKNITLSAASIQKVAHIQADANAKGISLGLDERLMTQDNFYKYMTDEGHANIAQLEAEGVYAVGKDGRLYAGYDMVKQQRNLNFSDVIELKDIPRLDRQQFLAVAKQILEASKPDQMAVILGVFKELSPFELFNKIVPSDIAIPNSVYKTFQATVTKVKEQLGESVIIDDLYMKGGKVINPIKISSLPEGPTVQIPKPNEVLPKTTTTMFSDVKATSPIKGEFVDARGATTPIWNRDLLDVINNDNYALATEGKVQARLEFKDRITTAVQDFAEAESLMINGEINKGNKPLWEVEYPVSPETAAKLRDNGIAMADMDAALDKTFFTPVEMDTGKALNIVKMLRSLGITKEGVFRKGAKMLKDTEYMGKEGITLDKVLFKEAEVPKQKLDVESPDASMDKVKQDISENIEVKGEELKRIETLEEKFSNFAGLWNLCKK